MKILIIGGNGFLGTHLALELKKRIEGENQEWLSNKK